MTILVTGDPASVSALAGELTRHGEELRERRATLMRVEAELHDWGGLAAEGFRAAFRTQVRALDDVVAAMTSCGHALQDYAVDLQHARARGAEAEEFCALHGLRLEPDGTVSPPWGPHSVDEAVGRADRVPEAQRRVRAAVDEADDAAQLLGRRVAEPVHLLTDAGRAALAAITTATTAAQTPPSQ